MTKALTLLSLAMSLAACGLGPNSSGSLGLLGLGEGGEIGGGNDGDGAGDEAGDDGDFDRDDCKIEDGQLGRTDVSIQLAGSTVRVASWTEKADSPGEYVGFTLALTGAELVFTVKAGGEVYDGSGASWAHPLGSTGPDVSAISHIDFCDNGMPEAGDEDAGDDAGDEDAGDDGDGACPPGTEGCGGGEAGDDTGGDGGDNSDEPVCDAEVCT